MKSLNNYIKSDKSSLISLSEKLVIYHQQVDEKLVIFPSQVNEKLVINKNFRDDDYELNTILKNVWNEISGNNKYDNNKIDADSLFVEAADVSNDHNYKLSDIDGALDVTRSFKKCKTIYMLESRHDIVLLDNLFLTLRKKEITLDELEWNESNSYSFEYKETDDFIILACGGDNYYYVFIGNK